jgi:hypothetical protein
MADANSSGSSKKDRSNLSLRRRISKRSDQQSWVEKQEGEMVHHIGRWTMAHFPIATHAMYSWFSRKLPPFDIQEATDIISNETLASRMNQEPLQRNTQVKSLPMRQNA